MDSDPLPDAEDSTAVFTIILMKVVGIITSGNRVTTEQEQTGLDISDHDEQGYSM